MIRRVPKLIYIANQPIMAVRRMSSWRTMFRFFGQSGTAKRSSVHDDPAAMAARGVDELRSRQRSSLNDAVNELSQGVHSSAPQIGIPPPTAAVQNTADLREWDSMDLKSLNKSQLEQLANAHFNGDFGALNMWGDEKDEPNIPRAIEIWEVASSPTFNSRRARYSLALCLREGNGSERSIGRAEDLLRDLVKEDDYALAHYTLGVMYQKEELGKDLSKDDCEKVQYEHFRAAAKGGGPPQSLYNVAVMLFDGRGVDQNEKTALQLLNVVVEAGDPAAMFTLGTWIVQQRAGLELDMDKAFQLFLQSGQAGHTLAMYNAGDCLLLGKGCEVDEREAAVWFEEASNRGLVQASVNLGSMYRDGKGVEKDLVKARNLYSRHMMTNKDCRELVASVEQQIEAEK